MSSFEKMTSLENFLNTKYNNLRHDTKKDYTFLCIYNITYYTLPKILLYEPECSAKIGASGVGGATYSEKLLIA